MTARSATMPFPARLKTELKLDPVLLTLVSVLLLGGLVILASASITISDNATGNPFFYLERQIVAAVLGIGAGLSVTWSLVVFAVLSLIAYIIMRQMFGIRRGQVKIWDRDIND